MFIIIRLELQLAVRWDSKLKYKQNSCFLLENEYKYCNDFICYFSSVMIAVRHCLMNEKLISQL